ncbi:MAG: hypothetical protein AAF962_19720 [Actinomycetota bacterium]
MATIVDHVADYTVDPTLGRDASVFITIKGFNQQAIVRKIIERKGKKTLGLTAADDTSKRRYSTGRIVFTTLGMDALDDEQLAGFGGIECVEPYHLTVQGSRVAYTSGDRFHLLGPEGVQEYTNPWMAYLHTVDFSDDGARMLIVSTGFDTIQEVDLVTGEVLWEWNAWDNGYTYAERIDTHFVRSAEQAARLEAAQSEQPGGVPSTVSIVDPALLPREGLATQQTPLNMNGVFYDHDGRVLATGYHRPELFVIGADGGHTTTDLGLLHPHSFRPLRTGYHQGYQVANTGRGELILVGEDLSAERIVDLSGLPADPEKKAGFGEWLQTVAPLDAESGLFLAVDALRSGVHVLDVVDRRRRFIPNPDDWTLQTVAPMEASMAEMIIRHQELGV